MGHMNHSHANVIIAPTKYFVYSYNDDHIPYIIIY